MEFFGNTYQYLYKAKVVVILFLIRNFNNSIVITQQIDTFLR